MLQSQDTAYFDFKNVSFEKIPLASSMVACGVSCQTRHIVTARIPPRVPGIPPQLVGANP